MLLNFKSWTTFTIKIARAFSLFKAENSSFFGNSVTGLESLAGFLSSSA